MQQPNHYIADSLLEALQTFHPSLSGNGRGVHLKDKTESPLFPSNVIRAWFFNGGKYVQAVRPPKDQVVISRAYQERLRHCDVILYPSKEVAVVLPADEAGYLNIKSILQESGFLNLAMSPRYVVGQYPAENASFSQYLLVPIEFAKEIQQTLMNKVLGLKFHEVSDNQALQTCMDGIYKQRATQARAIR